MKQIRLLLAEDDIDDRDFFAEFLRDRTDVLFMKPVENGEELMLALQATDAPMPDIILLDQNMPKMNGCQTLKLLKANDKYAAIPVIVYSTYATRDLEDACRQEGAAAIFKKPFDANGYNEMLDKILQLFNTSQTA